MLKRGYQLRSAGVVKLARKAIAFNRCTAVD
jgi:hypothetical protein